MDREQIRHLLLDARARNEILSEDELLRRLRIQKTQGTIRALKRAVETLDVEAAERGEPPLSTLVEFRH